MKAPEKIYLQEPTKVRTQKLYDNDIEYIRKDAFIEKACVKLEKLMYDSLMFQGRLHREEVIDNFAEDFKKYIKEE